MLSENYGGVVCTPLYEFSCCPALGFVGSLFEGGITETMGTRILDPLTMLAVVSEAGGTKKLHQYCGEKVAFRKKENP